jgi:hypothetical protein
MVGKSEIETIANTFESRECYPRTVCELRNISKDLEKNIRQPNFKRRIGLLYDLLEDEFVNTLPSGQDYRKECFKEMKITILRAVERLGYKFQDSTRVLVPILRRMIEVDRSLMPIADFYDALEDQCINDSNKCEYLKPIMFHITAYMYMVDVEGIFDELSRIFYYLTKVSKSFAPTQAKLESLTTKRVADELKPYEPVFLREREIKTHLRNAIGHARAHYNSDKDEVHFVDVDIRNGKDSFNETYPMSKFNDTWMELIDASAAFRFSLELLPLYDYV